MNSPEVIKRALKNAVGLAINMIGGPVKAATMLRVSASMLSRYTNEQRPDFAPIDICYLADKYAGEPVILRQLAELEGYELVRKQPRLCANNLVELSGECARDSGSLIAKALEIARKTNRSANDARDGLAVANLVEQDAIEIKEDFLRIARAS